MELSPPNMFQGHISCRLFNNPTSSRDLISSWVRFISVLISQISNITSLSNPYFIKRNLVLCNQEINDKCPKRLIIDYNNRILLQILRVKSCNHILMVHLINKRWCGNRKADVIFSLQVFIHMASTIDDKMTWMSKISYENVIRI